jgi:hypothetical protein
LGNMKPAKVFYNSQNSDSTYNVSRETLTEILFEIKVFFFSH